MPGQWHSMCNSQACGQQLTLEFGLAGEQAYLHYLSSLAGLLSCLNWQQVLSDLLCFQGDARGTCREADFCCIVGTIKKGSQEWRTDPTLLLHNQAAKKMMEDEGIPIIDTFSISAPLNDVSYDASHCRGHVDP
jgi:hypothetical protein